MEYAFNEDKVLQREQSGSGDFDKIVDPVARDLVQQLLSVDPARRPSAAEALQHKFFTTAS